MPALIGLAACARNAPAPAPLVPEALPAAEASSGTPATADSGSASAASDQEAADLPAAAPDSTGVQDSTSDEAFLDSLQAMSADSAVGPQPAASPAAASAPAAAPKEEEATAANPSGPAAPGPAGGAASAPNADATWDIDVERYTTNERVQYYLDYFQGRARSHFEVYLERLGRWESLVRAKLQAARMPQDLVYLALIESGMNPNAVSRRRAVGLWQFMASTGRRYGLTVNAWEDERRDPWKATDAAIRMISELNDHFGSVYLAAAAYDAGPGKIQRGLDRYDFGALSGNDLFFALADERFLRRETRDYVPKLIAAAMIAKEPAKYGFSDIERWAPLRYDSIEVTGAVGLDVLARLADTSTGAMLELNPEFIRRVTPPGRTVWVRVPVGRADSTSARLAVLPARRRVTFVEHTIRRGETLSYIGERYHVSVALIMSANRGLRPRSLRPGRVLIIPTSGIAPSRWSRSTGVRRGSASRTTALSSERGGATSYRVHIVREGDTPWSISRRYDVRLEDLLRENGLTRRSLIKPGQRIRIPS